MWVRLALCGLLTGCSRHDSRALAISNGASTSSSVQQSSKSVPSSVASSPPSASANVIAMAVPPLEPKGSVGFVVQRVEAVCMVGMGANGTRRFSVGTDLLLEVRADTDHKPQREFVFCPKRGADDTAANLNLNTWRMCRAYAGCNLVSSEASAERIELQCGKDHVSLETKAGHTVLEGPFGERELAPFPLRLAPTKREKREAIVDC
jgi:hypothetical protein